MNCSLVIMSCDAYEDLWDVFFTLKDKYWSCCPYKTYLITETKDSKYCETIKVQGTWTERLRKALEIIDTEYVIFMMDDFFIREYVDQERIDKIFNHFKNDIATFDFEKSFDTRTQNDEVLGFKLRFNKDSYLNNCQPSIHNRSKFIERLQENLNPWEWETKTLDSPYKFYINCDEWIIDIGHRRNPEGFGITRGKWAKECIEFLNKENIKVDFEKGAYLMEDYKLSIIIPYYKTYELTTILLDNLCSQLNDRTEVILIDDGCQELRLDKYPITIIHLEQNRGLSYARNKG